MTTEHQQQVQERVERERAAHTEDDVLLRAHQLKDRFPHIRKYRSLVALLDSMDQYLRNAKGMKVLDLGCGNGERSLSLLEYGAEVCGIDISTVYVGNCTEAALAAGHDASRFEFEAMDAHQLTYEDNTFDMVIGNGILHHLDLKVSTDEIKRVLKPGGRSIFVEPLSANPLLKVFRVFTPNARTVDEKPLSIADLRMFSRDTEWKVESSFCGIVEAPVAVATSLALRPWPNNPFLKAAYWCEKGLNAVPLMHPFNQYVLLNLVKN